MAILRCRASTVSVSMSVMRKRNRPSGTVLDGGESGAQQKLNCPYRVDGIVFAKLLQLIRRTLLCSRKHVRH
eukprot:scaffold348236_cov17-Prasinocladus_malaysianus.AAC.1